MRALTAIALLACATSAAQADEVSVAVAANFGPTLQRVAEAFARDTGHRVTTSLGASGRLYAQIVNGAPFEVFLSADAETAARLEAEARAVAGSRFTYAVGRLVLWSAQPGFVDAQGRVLESETFRHLALANPRSAPYGAAAVQVLRARGVYDAVQPRIVQAENVAQVQQFVASGNAELGFVALAQVWHAGALAGGSGWIVPAALHAPIRQDAVLLQRGRDRPAARALMAYLQSDAARAIVRESGYELPARP